MTLILEKGLSEYWYKEFKSVKALAKDLQKSGYTVTKITADCVEVLDVYEVNMSPTYVRAIPFKNHVMVMGVFKDEEIYEEGGDQDEV